MAATLRFALSCHTARQPIRLLAGWQAWNRPGVEVEGEVGPTQVDGRRLVPRACADFEGQRRAAQLTVLGQTVTATLAEGSWAGQWVVAEHMKYIPLVRAGAWRCALVRVGARWCAAPRIHTLSAAFGCEKVNPSRKGGWNDTISRRDRLNAPRRPRTPYHPARCRGGTRRHMSSAYRNPTTFWQHHAALNGGMTDSGPAQVAPCVRRDARDNCSMRRYRSV